MIITLANYPKVEPIPAPKNQTMQELIGAHKAAVVALIKSADAQDAAQQLEWGAKSKSETIHAQECYQRADYENDLALEMERSAEIALLSAVPHDNKEAKAKSEYLLWLYRGGRNGTLEGEYLNALLISICKVAS